MTTRGWSRNRRSGVGREFANGLKGLEKNVLNNSEIYIIHYIIIIQVIISIRDVMIERIKYYI